MTVIKRGFWTEEKRRKLKKLSQNEKPGDKIANALQLHNSKKHTLQNVIRRYLTQDDRKTRQSVQSPEKHPTARSMRFLEGPDPLPTGHPLTWKSVTTRPFPKEKK